MKRVDILSAACAALLMTPLPAMAEEHAGGSLPQLDVTLYPGVIFWFTTSFVVFFLFMQLFGAPGIQKTQANRAAILGSDLDAARKASEEAQKVVSDYEAALAQARQEAQETVSAILVESAKESEKHNEKLQKDLHHRAQVAEENIVLARQKAMEEAPKYVNGLVQDIYAKIMQVNI